MDCRLLFLGVCNEVKNICKNYKIEISDFKQLKVINLCQDNIMNYLIVNTSNEYIDISDLVKSNSFLNWNYNEKKLTSKKALIKSRMWAQATKNI